MYYIPHTIVDGFFDNPDEVRKYALMQDYKPDSENRYPGVRSNHLPNINMPLARTIVHKIGLLFDREDEVQRKTDTRLNIRMQFQKVPSVYNNGWIHSDHGSTVTGLIYLTPNNTNNSGTSLFHKKYEAIDLSEIEDIKKNHFSEIVDNKLSKANEEVNSLKDKFDSQFNKVVDVKDVYNRLFLFDSYHYHSANKFDTTSEERLTLVLFFNDWPFTKPIEKLRTTFL